VHAIRRPIRDCASQRIEHGHDAWRARVQVLAQLSS
jgi:hypothetical protein